MKNNIVIYELVDPVTNETRYVGKTYISSLSRRYNQHLKIRGQNPHKDNWINKLLSEGNKPTLNILEYCNNENWQEREIYWIGQFENLVNFTKGGSGVIPPSGVKHFNSKINRKIVKRIVYLYRNTSVTIEGLSRLLNIGVSTVAHIVQGESWKEITGGEKIKPLVNKRKGKHNINVGSNHAISKLNENDIIEIKKLVNEGVPLKEIADKYTVSSATIHYIKIGKTWKHVK